MYQTDKVGNFLKGIYPNKLFKEFSKNHKMAFCAQK